MSWLCSDKQQPPLRGRFHYVSGTWKGRLALRLWLEGLIPSCPSPHSSVDRPSQENAAECQAGSAGSVQASEPGLGDSDRRICVMPKSLTLCVCRGARGGLVSCFLLGRGVCLGCSLPLRPRPPAAFCGLGRRQHHLLPQPVCAGSRSIYAPSPDSRSKTVLTGQSLPRDWDSCCPTSA